MEPPLIFGMKTGRVANLYVTTFKVHSTHAKVPSQLVRSRTMTKNGLSTSSPLSFLEASLTPFTPLLSPSNLTLLTSRPGTYRQMANSTPTQLTPYPRTPQPPRSPKPRNGSGKSSPSLESKLSFGWLAKEKFPPKFCST